MTRQFIKFVAVGGIAAGVNFLSRIAISHYVAYATAIVTAYLLGMITAFVLNRIFIFRNSTNNLHKQIFWFCIVNLAAVLQTLLASLFLKDIFFPRIGFTWHTEALAHAVGVIIPITTSFLGHKHFSFRNTEQ